MPFAFIPHMRSVQFKDSLETRRERQTCDFALWFIFISGYDDTHGVIRFAEPRARALIQPQINLFKFFQINRIAVHCVRECVLCVCVCCPHASPRPLLHHETPNMRNSDCRLRRRRRRLMRLLFRGKQPPLNMALTIRTFEIVVAVPWMNMQWARNRSFVVNLVCTVY